jgi:hypothetical protein
MVMNAYCKILIFLIFLNHPFQKEVEKGVAFLKENKKAVLEIKSTSNTEGAEALAIVFPEIIRWSVFQDFVETTALETIYVQKGREKANFSIGHFQMKPGFIEDLENYVSAHTELATFSYVIIKGKSEKESRKERIYRMQQLPWQLRYAHVYWLVAKDKFKDRTFKDAKGRVRFFAAAYNYGFLRPIEEIEKRVTQKSFPFGVNYKKEQVAYTDLAIEFYEKYAKDFEK